MTTWDIDVPGVQGVLKKTQTVAEEFNGQLKKVQTALQTGAKNTSSTIVAKAISEFVDQRQTDIEFVLKRTGSALTAAAQATQAYVNGDLEMAANAQRAAGQAPDGDGGAGHDNRTR